MCTAAAYKTKDFYFGRTLDYEFSYGDEIAVTPRNYVFDFRHSGKLENHYAIIGMAHVAGDYPGIMAVLPAHISEFKRVISRSHGDLIAV